MKKICVILAMLVCALAFVACKETKAEKQNSAPDNVALTVEERKDIFVSYFNHCTEYSATDIEQNLDKIENLQVLTLDEALNIFWQKVVYLPMIICIEQILMVKFIISRKKATTK